MSTNRHTATEVAIPLSTSNKSCNHKSKLSEQQKNRKYYISPSNRIQDKLLKLRHNYEVLMSSKNAEECYMILKEKILTATEHHIPRKRIRPTNNPPWFSRD
ncbi:hypothetical protein FHG87_006875 [Trinorchestia longiramus]|nr:hypothetical protein FHG87_006875 [Trinorchestia longiramus]